MVADCWADEPEMLAAERADSAGASGGGDVSRTEAIATMLRSSTAIIGMKTFHYQRIPVAHRTMGGSWEYHTKDAGGAQGRMSQSLLE
jgi:hypothetical protein